MAETKPDNTDATVMGLPEVRTDSTLDLEGARSTAVVPMPDLGLTPNATSPDLPSIKTDPMLASAPRVLAESTAPSLPPIVTPPAAPPRTRTGGIPRTRTAGAIPKPEVPRRATREVAASDDLEAAQPTREPLPPLSEKEPFEWTHGRVAGLAAAVSFAAVLLWVFWPAKQARRPTPPVAPVAVVAETPEPTPREKPAIAPEPALAAPEKPALVLEAKQHVIDPYGAHADDLPLDPAHKYRLRLERDDPRLGVTLARLEEKGGWGVMRKMASHALLQFGGAKTLRLHCEPGTRFVEGQTFPLELQDLATRKNLALTVDPSKHCWDFELARIFPLGEGVKVRVRVPTDAKLMLGPDVPLRVAWVLEALGDTREWRTGVLKPGESLLAEGRLARFAILDSYSGDNDGALALELLDGDTENAGLVTPTGTGAQFVPVQK